MAGMQEFHEKVAQNYVKRIKFCRDIGGGALLDKKLKRHVDAAEAAPAAAAAAGE